MKIHLGFNSDPTTHGKANGKHEPVLLHIEMPLKTNFNDNGDKILCRNFRIIQALLNVSLTLCNNNDQTSYRVFNNVRQVPRFLFALVFKISLVTR